MQGEGKEKRKIIRSRHFLQRRIPTINCKCIPLHNQYGLTVAERFRPFESMAMPRLFPHTSRKLDMGRNNLKMESSPPKNVLDKSKMLLRKYLTRKDRFSSCIDIDPMYDWQFGSVEVNKYSTEKSRNSGRTSKTHKYRKSVGSIGPQQLSIRPHSEQQINSGFGRQLFLRTGIKNLYEMTHQQLRQSIQQKKQFLHLLNIKHLQNKMNPQDMNKSPNDIK